MDMSVKNPAKDNKVLNQVLAMMPEKGQQVIKAFWDGHTQLEVSRMTNLSQAAVNYYKNLFKTKASIALGIWCV